MLRGVLTTKCLSIIRHGHTWSQTLPSSAGYIVVGGGVTGASTAYHLAKLGVGHKTILLESDKLTCGTTWHSAAMLNTLRSNVVEARLTQYTKTLASEVLEQETGQSTGYKRHGGLTVTGNPDMMIQMQRECDVSSYTGNMSTMVTPDQCREIFPPLDTTGLLGGIYCPSDGSVDPTSLTMAYIRGASDLGVRIFEGCHVEDIATEAGQVQEE